MTKIIKLNCFWIQIAHNLCFNFPQNLLVIEKQALQTLLDFDSIEFMSIFAITQTTTATLSNLKNCTCGVISGRKN